MWFRPKRYTEFPDWNGADRVIGSGIFAAQLNYTTGLSLTDVRGIAMLLEVDSLLDLLREWLRAAGPWAERQAALLQKAAAIVVGEEQAVLEERRRLADRLERWRYVHLRRCGAQWTPMVCRLAEVLDHLVARLSDRPGLAARTARFALENTFCPPPEEHRARECLNPLVPLQTVVARAQRLTDEHFGRRRMPRPHGLERGPLAATDDRVPAGALPDDGTHRDAAADVMRGARDFSSSAVGPPVRRMHLYAPIYLTSQCVNYCLYCGFRFPHGIRRRHLSVEEACRQAELLRRRGLYRVLLVAGEFPSLASIDYLEAVVAAVAEMGLTVDVEVAPQSVGNYARLVRAGLNGVTLYQELYDRRQYERFHPRGPKACYDWRLEGVERAAEAGVRRLNLGILLGLGDAREELTAMIRHAVYLRNRFPECRWAFSLPRIHRGPPGFEIPSPVSDELLVRMFCALRVAFPAAELVLSTREREPLRNHLAEICITHLSAGSSTVPGGYGEPADAHTAEGQFPVCDTRSIAEVIDWCRRSGFAVC